MSSHRKAEEARHGANRHATRGMRDLSPHVPPTPDHHTNFFACCTRCELRSQFHSPHASTVPPWRRGGA
eukprot:4759427-Pyramimonas_sp.AAC.1